MEIVTLVLRLILVVLGLALLALAAGSLTRPGVGWAQKCRFVFVGGCAAVAGVRGVEMLAGGLAEPLWAVIAVDVLLVFGVVGTAHFYWEFPAIRWPKPRPRGVPREPLG